MSQRCRAFFGDMCSDGTRKGGTYLCFAWGPRRLPAFLPTEDFMPALLVFMRS